MKYSFTFYTVAAYLAAKSDGGAIYTALVTNSEGYVSRTAISTIKSTGQTFIDAFNVIVPREQGGEIGDTLLFNSQDSKYYWLKSKKDYNVNSLGGMYATLSGTQVSISGYTEVGFVVSKEGRDCLILRDVGSYKWGDGTGEQIDVPSLTDYSSVLGNDAGLYSVSSISEEFSNYLITKEGRTTGYILQRAMPVLRTAWERLKSIVNSGSTTISTEDLNYIKSGISGYDGAQGSNPHLGLGWGDVNAEIDGNGEGKITYYTSSSAQTLNLKDWNYDYSRWIKSAFLAKFPASRGALIDSDGRSNTQKIIRKSGATSTIFPAAFACASLNVGGLKGWWFASLGEAVNLQRHGVTLKGKGIIISDSALTSTQASESGAWALLNSTSSIYFAEKSYARQIYAANLFRI